MRVLQVVHGFPPNEWTGTELVTLHLSQALHERGHEVTVLTRVYDAQSAEGTLRETTYNNLPVFQLVNNYTASTTFRLSYDNPLFNRPFLQVLKRAQPDVVHFQHTQHLSVSLLRLASALGYPTILSLHDFFFACHRIQLINAQQQLCPGPDQGERCVTCLQALAGADDARYRFSEMRRVLHAPDVVLTPSVFLADKMKKYFPFITGRIRTIPLGVAPIAGIQRQRPPRSPDVPLRVLYVGVLAPHKGAHVLLEAVKGLPRDKVVVSLYGMEWARWQSYLDQLHAAAAGLPVKFCGSYAQEQLGSILIQHDVLVMPMIWEETFSLIVREALLAGLPVVAARRGALIEAVQDGANGLFFEPENATSLRHSLERLIADPALLDLLRGGTPRVKTMAEYAEDIDTVYAEVRQARKQEKKGEKGEENPEDQRLLGESTTRPPVKVSVCIPTYNGSAFLAEAIQSVLDQSFSEFELLVVDDCSTDNTLAIARALSDPRLHVHENVTQRGIPGNWNRAIELARGEYICIFHQDDVMLPENLERKVSVLDANANVSFVHSAVEFVIEGGTPQPPGNWIEPAVDDFVADGHRYFRKLLLRGNMICAPSVVARRRCLMEAGMFDEELGYTPDYEMWLKLCAKGQAAFISQPLLQYRWHGNNASHHFRFSRGVDELQLAARRALQYSKKIGRFQNELEILEEVIEALGVLRQWTATLEQGKEWVEQQRENWQEATRERDRLLQEQKAWIAELEKSKSWLNEQRDNWQRMTERQEKTLQESQAWIAELEKGKQWLEDERRQWQAEAERWRAQAHGWQSRLWTRIGVRLRVLVPPAPISSDPATEAKDD